MLIMSCSDVGFDIQLACQFINGINYTYMFANESDPAIIGMNCTKLYVINDSDVIHPYRYTCFVHETTYGFWTLALTFVPGLLLSLLISYGLWKNTSKFNSLLVIVLTPCFVATFPILVISGKVIATSI